VIFGAVRFNVDSARTTSTAAKVMAPKVMALYYESYTFYYCHKHDYSSVVRVYLEKWEVLVQFLVACILLQIQMQQLTASSIISYFNINCYQYATFLYLFLKYVEFY
jgi:hypothetical protein